MRRPIALVLVSLILAGCGEPRTITLNHIHTVGGSGQYVVVAKVVDVGGGILTYKEGETAWTNIRLRDDTGESTFHFLPSQQSRQPVVGDSVKVLIRGKRVQQTPGGSPTVRIIETFEYR